MDTADFMAQVIILIQQPKYASRWIITPYITCNFAELNGIFIIVLGKSRKYHPDS